MSMVPRCTVCDSRVDPYLRPARCPRCEQSCGVCGGDVAMCLHPLPEPLVEVEQIAPGRIAA